MTIGPDNSPFHTRNALELWMSIVMIWRGQYEASHHILFGVPMGFSENQFIDSTKILPRSHIMQNVQLCKKSLHGLFYVQNKLVYMYTYVYSLDHGGTIHV